MIIAKHVGILLTVVTLFLLSVSRTSAQTQNLETRHVLSVGESVCVDIYSACYWNRTAVILEAGAHYQFQVSACDTWKDASIVCRASGWCLDDIRPLLRPVVRAAECKRRMPSADWFELVGVHNGKSCQMFRIGCRGAGWTFSPDEDGEFLAFANDLANRYANNSGSIRLTITRVPQPALPLPTR